MSFPFPTIFKSSHQPSVPPHMETATFEIPSFDRRDEIKVLPYDYAAGELAKRALLLSGATILRDKFGESPERARQKTAILAEEVAALGSTTLHELEPRADEKPAEDRIDDLWKDKALQGDDAMLTLLSLKQLANTRDQGFYADRAADVLGDVTSDATRIALK